MYGTLIKGDFKMNETEIKILEGDDVTTQSKTPKNTSKKPTPLVHGPTSPEDRLMLEWDGEENELTVNGKYGTNPFISITKIFTIKRRYI